LFPFGLWLGMSVQNFTTVAQYMAELLRFVQKSKMAAAAILD